MGLGEVLTTPHRENEICYEIFTDKASDLPGNVACMAVGRVVACTGVWWGSQREGDRWGDPGVDRSLILRWISTKWDWGLWS